MAHLSDVPNWIQKEISFKGDWGMGLRKMGFHEPATELKDTFRFVL